jgi:phage gp29-like protein
MSLFSKIKSAFTAPDKVDFRRIINPNVRDRWASSVASNYTPEQVASVLRGAMSGNLVAQWEMFDLMEGAWPRLAKNLQELKGAVVSLDWSIQPWAMDGDPTPEAQRRAELLEEAVWNMRPRAEADENDFEDTIRDLLDAWGKGISVLEIEWSLQMARQSLRAATSQSMLWAPRNTRWINPRYYGYPSNATSLQLCPDGNGANFIAFPENKFLVGVAKAKTGHPVGAALMRVLGFWWAASNFSASWFLNFAQVFGQPIRWATYDPSQPGLVDLVSEMLEEMGSSAWGAFPQGTVLELKEAVKTAGDNPQKVLLEIADRVCDIAILRQTLTTDAGDKGTQALGTVHQAVRADVIQEASNWVARVLNSQFVPAFCRLNFGDETMCPWFAPSMKQVKDAESLARRDQILFQMGVPLPKQWFYERHDVPVPNPEDVLETRPVNNPPADLGDLVKGKSTEPVGQEKLAQRVMEDLTGVEARWLAGIKPVFMDLVQAAQSRTITDEEFERVIERAARDFPELFDKLDTEALAGSLEAAMGASVVNGAVFGSARRKS